ncbi:GWxTD domain-containing protein, partial [Candidatus Fermentibacterales bacterium]|nr:GWxTD domain-containing protein [Candidatus Fermentibacterales bacterium]
VLVASGDTLSRRKPVILSRMLAEGGGDGGGSEAFSGPARIDELKLLLTPGEMSLINRLGSPEAGEQFYADYWSVRGGDREREVFESRCEGAERFSTAFQQGFETSRGRVYIIYGPPDDIESITLETGMLPHEIWRYYTGGGETFVFLDRDGTGSYEQIYSTVGGEASYENWQEMIMPVGAYSESW